MRISDWSSDLCSSDLNILAALHSQGTRLVALRCAGFNHVDLEAAEALEIAVARWPAYSPEAIAEHTVALILSLNRKLHRAYVRVREGNFALDGLLGFNLGNRTVGIVGTGRIGAVVANILQGFGCTLLAFDPVPDEILEQRGGTYVPVPELMDRSDIETIHCPTTPQQHQLIDTNYDRKRVVKGKGGSV